MKNARTSPFVMVSPFPSDPAIQSGTASLTQKYGTPGPLSARDNGVLRNQPSTVMRNRVAGGLGALGDFLPIDIQAWDLRVDGINPVADATYIETQGAFATAAIQYQFNGTTYDRVRSAGAASLSADPVVGAQLVTGPGQWTEVHVPAINTIATITKAAGAAGERHVCQAILATLSSGATATGIQLVYLRDGLAGVGPIIWAGTLESITGHHAHIEMDGLNIIGSAATAMTLEFAAAGSVTSQEVVSFAGITVA